MADDGKKKGGEPTVEFRWDPLTPAHDKTFSTTIRVEVSGWWEEGRPKEVALSIYEGGQEPSAGNPVRIQKGFGTFPLTGLKPGHHYHVVVYIGDRTPVQKMIIVPELPKPAKPEKVICSDLMVRFSGPRGKQKFVVSVNADDGTLIPDHPIGLINGDKFVGLKTNGNGFAFYEADFQESSRYFEVRAGNSHNLMWRARLLGPRPEEKE
jgi:hypothetical protein